MSKNNEIVRFDNRLVFHGSYNLSARASKTICYVVAKYVDATSDELPDVIRIPVADLSEALMDGREGHFTKSLYTDIERLCHELTSNPIRFKSDVEVDGIDLNGYVTWCTRVIPKLHEGVKCIEFSFNPFLGQFLQGLSKYVRVYRPELNRLTTGYAIRFFQMLKGEGNRQEKFRTITVCTFSVERLRFLFGVEGKYGGYKDFNRCILKPSVEQINERTTIRVCNVKPIRKQGGRKVTHVEFSFINRAGEEEHEGAFAGEIAPHDFVPGDGDEGMLSRSQLHAYEELVGFGVKPGIAYRQIIGKIAGSESHGFEDYFIRFALEHFRKRTRNTKSRGQMAATFVNWWVQHKIFDVTSDTWSVINEKVVGVRKEMERTEPEKYANRLVARAMTNAAFEAWYLQKDNGTKPVQN